MNKDDYERPLARTTKRTKQRDGRQMRQSDRQYPLGTKLSWDEHLWLKARARALGQPINKILGDLIHRDYQQNPVPLD